VGVVPVVVVSVGENFACDLMEKAVLNDFLEARIRNKACESQGKSSMNRKNGSPIVEQTNSKSRSGLTPNQLQVLQSNPRINEIGTVLDIPYGQKYQAIEEVIGEAEYLVGMLSSHASNKNWRLHFVPVRSNTANAYAIWQSSFQAVCITTQLINELDVLSDQVTRYLLSQSNNESRFSFLKHQPFTLEKSCQILKKLLLRGAVAFVVAHEVGHIIAGHQGALSSIPCAKQSESEEVATVLDAFALKNSDEPLNSDSLLTNAHELDADIQGIHLTAAMWKQLQAAFLKSDPNSDDRVLINHAVENDEKLLLIASAGAMIALALFGFQSFSNDWKQRPSHPLTAVRCFAVLSLLSDLILRPSEEKSGLLGVNLNLHPVCAEALFAIHGALGRIVLKAYTSGGLDTDVARQLHETPSSSRLSFMLQVTGIQSVVENINEVKALFHQLGAELKKHETKRNPFVRVSNESLIQWS
jgi:Peptidase family M48